MVTWQRTRGRGVGRRRVTSPRLRLFTLRAAIAALLLSHAGPLYAAFTEPRLALMRATPFRATGGATTLSLEGSFSFADAVQLGMPLTVVVTQGQLSARFDLAGTVSISVGGGAVQPAPGPGVIGFTQREITLVLPRGFSPGAATVQVVADFDGKPIASNQLAVTL
jgi:hypothetical protein